MTDTPEAAPAEAAPAEDPRAVAHKLLEDIDDSLRRLYDFHAAGDLESARAVGGQLAAHHEKMKALIG